MFHVTEMLPEILNHIFGLSKMFCKKLEKMREWTKCQNRKQRDKQRIGAVSYLYSKCCELRDRRQVHDKKEKKRRKRANE